MYPVLFYIGSIPIWSYGTFIALGMIMLFAMALISARRDGQRWDQLLPIAMGVLVGGAFGARLSHLIVEPGIEADLSSRTFHPEDSIVLCTDGASGWLNDNDGEKFV